MMPHAMCHGAAIARNKSNPDTGFSAFHRRHCPVSSRYGIAAPQKNTGAIKPFVSSASATPAHAQYTIAGRLSSRLTMRA